MKEKLGKQDFHYEMEDVFELATGKRAEAPGNQKQLSEKQLQILRVVSQTTTQAIQDQTRAIRESSNALKRSLQKPVKERTQAFDETTNRNNQILT